MHRCLLISEIASLICFHGFEGWGGRKSIIAFAQTCRTCYEPAVNVIWNEIPNLKPLLDLLPKETWAKIDRRKYTDSEILEALQLTNWSSFEGHAKRVRVYGFQYGQPPDIGPDQYYSLLLLGESRGIPLLPNVEKLYISSLNPYFLTSLPLVTTPNLLLFHCTPTYGKTSRKGLILLSELLTELGMRYPRLKKLVVDLGKYGNIMEVPNALTAALYSCEWVDLAHIHVSPLTSGVFNCLPKLPSLEYVKMNISDIPDTERRPFPPNVRPYELYRALKNVDLSCEDLSVTIDYLHTMPKETRLKSLSILCQESSEHPRWQLLCRAIEDHCDHISLKDLAINDIGTRTSAAGSVKSFLTIDHLRPLCSFNYLTRIKLHTQATLDLDDAQLQRLALSWPQVQFLALVGVTPCDSPPKVTLSSLAFLAENCPELQSLYLLFDAENVPRFLPADAPVSGKNLEFLSVMDSPLSDPSGVTFFLHRLFPKLRRTVKGHQSRLADPQRELELMKLWNRVELSLQELGYRESRRKVISSLQVKSN